MRNSVIAITALVALEGCSAGADMALGEAEIAKFHAALNASQLDAIYSNADPALHEAAKPEEFNQLLFAVHRKLGPYQSGKTATWVDNATPGGRFLTINYASQYSRGAAQENFVYRLANGQARLVGYHINSTALIVN
jgi:hypothetical protein